MRCEQDLWQADTKSTGNHPTSADRERERCAWSRGWVLRDAAEVHNRHVCPSVVIPEFEHELVAWLTAILQNGRKKSRARPAIVVGSHLKVGRPNRELVSAILETSPALPFRTSH